MILARSAIQWGDMAGWVSGAVTLAAVIVALWLAGQSRRDAARDAERRDLDETRRLLVIALALRTDPGPEFMGTVAHALAKHSKLADLENVFAVLLMAVGRSSEPTILGWIGEIDARLEQLG